MGAILSDKITTKQTLSLQKNKKKKMALNKPWKGQLYRELKQEGRVLPSVTSAGNIVCQMAPVFHCYMHIHESTPRVDLGVNQL